MNGHWYRVLRVHGTRVQWFHHHCNSGRNQLHCSGNLYLKVLAWCLRFRYRICVLWQPVLLGARDSLQLSYIQVFRVFQICVMGVSFFPLNNYLLIQFELFLGLTPCKFPHRTYLWFRAGRHCNRASTCLSLKDVWVFRFSTCRVCPKQTYFHGFASSQTSTRGYQQISFFQCITFALSDVVWLIIQARSIIQNLAGDEYVTASKHAFEQDFGQCGTGHSYEIYF